MKKITSFIFTLFITVSVFAQNTNTDQLELDSGTIEAQFDVIINKSTKFKAFQLIRRTSIFKVKAHTIDTIKTIREDLSIANNTITETENSIKELEKEVEDLKNEVTLISENIDSISFMGTSFKKANYNFIIWSIITVLFLGTFLFISMFKKSNTSTKNAQSNLTKTEDEFEAFRKKSMLKEQETMRKLQDERNKHS